MTLLIDGRAPTSDQLANQALVNYGAYTSFRVEGGAVRGLDRHLARVDASAIELFGAPVGEARLRELMRLAVDGQGDCWLRTSLFSLEISHRSPSWIGAPSVMTAVFPPPAPLAEGVLVQVQTHVRHAPHLKTTATFDLIRARRRARAEGFDDALFADSDGFISEGTLWNLGLLRGDMVVWPDAPMLPGVTQALIEEGLFAQGLASVREPVHAANLAEFETAFLCNSATPAASIAAIGDHRFAPAPVDRLRAAWLAAPPQPL